MKLFLKHIEKTNPIVKLINVAAFSDFALGVKVTKDDILVEDDIQLFAADGTEIQPMETTYGDFVAFALTAGDGPHQDIYTVKSGTDSYPITIDVETKSTAEIGGAGGSGPSGDFVPTEAEDEDGNTWKWDPSETMMTDGSTEWTVANAGYFTVVNGNLETEEVSESVELEPDSVAVIHVNTDESVSKGELKYDGVYLDNNGYKSLEVVGTTEDDEQITFKVLGYEVQA